MALVWQVCRLRGTHRQRLKAITRPSPRYNRMNDATSSLAAFSVCHFFSSSPHPVSRLAPAFPTHCLDSHLGPSHLPPACFSSVSSFANRTTLSGLSALIADLLSRCYSLSSLFCVIPCRIESHTLLAISRCRYIYFSFNDRAQI